MNATRFCARPGCQGPVAAWLTYDYAARRVWLDDRLDGEGGDHWALCGTHAGRLQAPQGWVQVDRRVGHRPPSDLPTALVS